MGVSTDRHKTGTPRTPLSVPARTQTGRPPPRCAFLRMDYAMGERRLRPMARSNDGECVIGMAVGVRAVHGSINCKALKSDDGKHLVSFRGTYTT